MPEITISTCLLNMSVRQRRILLLPDSPVDHERQPKSDASRQVETRSSKARIRPKQDEDLSRGRERGQGQGVYQARTLVSPRIFVQLKENLYK